MCQLKIIRHVISESMKGWQYNGSTYKRIQQEKETYRRAEEKKRTDYKEASRNLRNEEKENELKN